MIIDSIEEKVPDMSSQRKASNVIFVTDTKLLLFISLETYNYRLEQGIQMRSARNIKLLCEIIR